MEQCKLIKLAMLGSKEAAKRLTDVGVLVPCAWCGMQANRKPKLAGYGKSRWVHCPECGSSSKPESDVKSARLAWNTRAPILSAEEMEMLNER